MVCDLTPGTVLFIPSLWFHNVTSEEGVDPTISVNAFWRHLPPDHYERKDLYGNRDLCQVGTISKCGSAMEVQRLSERPTVTPHV